MLMFVLLITALIAKNEITQRKLATAEYEEEWDGDVASEEPLCNEVSPHSERPDL